MKPLKDVLPDASDKILYVFYDFETTQNTKYSDKATLHLLDLVCVQQFCSQCKPRPWANKIVAIAHNAKAFYMNFILNRAIMLKWKPELIISGLKFMYMKMEHVVFLDSVSFLTCEFRKLPEAFGLSASKS